MIKLGIFGDSFAASHIPIGQIASNNGPIIGVGWPTLVHIKEKDILVTNFASGGSSIHFSYDKFLRYHQYFEKIVFVITNLRRMWVPSAYGPFCDSGKLLTKFHFIAPSHPIKNPQNMPFANDKSKRTMKAVDDYYNLIHDPIQDWHNWQLRIQSIHKIRPDAVIIPAFTKKHISTQINYDDNSQYFSPEFKKKYRISHKSKRAEYTDVDDFTQRHGGQDVWRPGYHYDTDYPILFDENVLWGNGQMSLEEIAALDTYSNVPEDFLERAVLGFGQYDKRSCHLNPKNNDILADKIIKWIKEGTFENTNSNDYVKTINEMSFWGKCDETIKCNNITRSLCYIEHENGKSYHLPDINFSSLIWKLNRANILMHLLGKNDERIIKEKETIYKDLELWYNI